MAVPFGPASAGRLGDFGVPVPLFPVRVWIGDPGFHQYVASRDGQRFLVNTVTGANQEVISAIVNWSPPR